MNRRSFLNSIAAIPFVGPLVKAKTPIAPVIPTQPIYFKSYSHSIPISLTSTSSPGELFKKWMDLELEKSFKAAAALEDRRLWTDGRG